MSRNILNTMEVLYYHHQGICQGIRNCTSINSILYKLLSILSFKTETKKGQICVDERTRKSPIIFEIL